LFIVAVICLCIWRARLRRRRKTLAHENAVAAGMDGRRSTGRLTLIDDEEDGGFGQSSSTERSSSGHGRTSSHGSREHSDSYSGSGGRVGPNDSAGQMTSQTPFPPVSLLAASYNRRKSSSSNGHGGFGGGNGGRYQPLPTETARPGRRSPSPPRFSEDFYRDPFSDSPPVTFHHGAKSENKSAPIMGELPVDLFAQKRESRYDDPFSSAVSFNTGVTTPKDLEVRNVFDEELGSVPQIRRKPMLTVQNAP